MTIATYTITETAATSVARQIKIGVRAKSGSSIPSKAADWKGGAFPVMTFDLAAGATSATATVETVGNTAVDGNREFEFYEVSRSPNGGTLTMNPSFGTITDDDTYAPVVISNWQYSDDLEDAAVGTNVLTRPNWTASGANTDTFKVSSAHGLYNSQLYRQNSFIQFGPAVSDDFGWEYELDENRSGTPGNGRSDAYSNTAQNLYLIYKDADNYIQMGNDGRIGIDRTKTAGTETYRGGFFDHGLTTAPDWTAVGSPASRKVRYQVHNGKLRIRGPHDEWMLRASQLKYPYGTYGIDALGGFDTAAGRIGPAVYRTATYVYDTINGVRLRPLKMVITSHARFCSRRPNAGSTAPENFGRISVSGDYKGTATRWAYRLLTVPIPKTVAQDWRDCADVVAASGQFSVNCQVPFGFMGEIELAMTDSDGVTHATTTKRVACGKVFLSYGQSNSGGRQAQASGLTAYSQKAACRSYTSDSNSEGIPAFEIAGLGTVEHPFANAIEGARIYADVSGIPCLMAATGIAGSGIANLFAEPNFTNFFGALRNVYDGWIDGVIWDQGEGDRDGAAANNTYFDTFDAGYQKMVTATGNPNLPMWISPIGRYASANAPGSDKGYTWAQIDGNSKPVFAAYQAMIDKYPGKVRYADSKLGQRHAGTDAYHYTSGGYQSMMRRFARTVLDSEGRAAPDGRGPLVTGITRSGATLTLALNMNDATGLTDLVSTTTVDSDVAGTPALQGLYGYQVSTDNFATAVAISSIAVNTARTALVITLAADPGKAVQVRSFFGASYDDRQLFWGTYDGGFENVPVFPIYVPLTSN